MDPDGVSSCASHSNSLISLSYSMAVFSTNSFRLFSNLSMQLMFFRLLSRKYEVVGNTKKLRKNFLSASAKSSSIQFVCNSLALDAAAATVFDFW